MTSTPLSDQSFATRMNGYLSLPPGRTAVVTIDMQREYLDPQVGRNLLHEDVCAPLRLRTSQMLGEARRRDLPVVHVYVQRRPQEVQGGLAKSLYSRVGTSNGLTQNQSGRLMTETDRLIGSPQSELARELSADGDVHITGKKTMDGFMGTELDLLLRRGLGVDTVVLAGVNTDTCIMSTALSAANRGYRTIIASDCTGSIRGSTTHESALQLIGGAFAWVLTSEQIWTHMT